MYTMHKKKLPTHKRRAVSKFVAEEMRDERKKPEGERRKMDQILAIGYSKARKGEL